MNYIYLCCIIFFSSIFFITSFQLISSLLSNKGLYRNKKTEIIKQYSSEFSLSNDDNNKVGLIIVDHGSRKDEANQRVITLAEKYIKFGTFDIVEPAHMELAEPSLDTAFKNCVEKGAKKIICHPFFLTKGRHVQEDIPFLLEKAASKYSNIEYIMTEPTGNLEDQILKLIDYSVQNHATKK